jgi:6-phosphogluconolactonase (cycloisomerase 2 family)
VSDARALMADSSTATIAGASIRDLTTARPIKLTSTRGQSAWSRNTGRGPLLDAENLFGQPEPASDKEEMIAPQRGIQPHMVPYDPSGRFLVVPDKGGDKVCVFRFDASAGKLTANDRPFVKSREGAGPRHIVFHPTKRFAYLVNEMDSTIATYSWDSEKGVLKALQILPATPSSFTRDNTSAGIAISSDARFVFMSNRGHDSIVSYGIDDVSGLLSPVGWEPTQGKQPRFFTLSPDGKFLYAANENSDTIVTFRVDNSSGKLTPTGQVVKTGSLTCVVFRLA